MKQHRLRSIRIAVALGFSTFSFGTVWADEPRQNRLTSSQASPSDVQAIAPPNAPEAGYFTSQRAAAAPVEVQCACAVVCNCGAEKKKKEELSAAMKGAYAGVFYANNFAYLNSTLYDGPYFPGDPLKGLADGKLDLGGEYRTRYHNENNHRGTGLTGNDDQFWLTRLRLFANYRVTDNIRVFGEFLYADSAGENFAPRTIEENRGEAQNLFVDAKLTDNLTIRGGRQELLLGAQRLISPLDWANTRRTFDGARATYKGEDWTVDGFYTNPVARIAATGGRLEWDNSSRDQHFYGVYGTKMGAIGNANLDTYYLGYDDDTLAFSFHTLGSRVWGATDNFLYELEGGSQFGNNSNGSDHSASFVTAGLGRNMDVCTWKPTLWLWYDWASGASAPPLSAGDDGFHHLFPLAHKYNGFMDLFGRRNLHDVNVQFIAPVNNKVNFLVWYHYFFLDQATTPYGVTMAPYNAAAPAGSKDLGHEIDFLATLNINPRNSVLVGYSFFDAGQYYQTTPGVLSNADADFFYCQFQSSF